MKVLILAIAVLLVAVAVIVLIGCLLPRRHVVACRAFYRTSPEQLWTVLADPGQGASWRRGLTGVHRLDSVAGRERWSEDSRGGTITYELVEAQAPVRRVVRIADETLPFGGRWIYTLAARDHGALLTITEDGEVFNPVFRFVSALIIGHTATVSAFLVDLGRRCGETVVPEAASPVL